MENDNIKLIIHLKHVLILIIMEDTHGDGLLPRPKPTKGCLNPYYNGRYSWRSVAIKLRMVLSLNPYYNGRYSWSLSEGMVFQT